MKLITLGVVAALAIGSAGMAQATELINNGDFSQTSPAKTGPWQFGSNSGTGRFFGGSSCSYGGNFISGWSGNGGYEIWYNNYSAASTVEPCTQYTETQLLSAITDPAAAGASFTSFVGLDGISSPVPNAGISQSVSGLTPGQKYKVTFWWGNTQLQNRDGDTTEYLKVSLGGAPSQATAINSIGTHGWSGWAPVSMVFTADSSTSILSFLSIGTPNSLPPFALLGGVSMQAVPEPPVLAMFGGGLLGLGLLTGFARRRALRRIAVVGDDDIG